MNAIKKDLAPVRFIACVRIDEWVGRHLRPVKAGHSMKANTHSATMLPTGTSARSPHQAEKPALGVTRVNKIAETMSGRIVNQWKIENEPMYHS